MADDKTKQKGATQEKIDPKIDAIKQLIFGDNMIEYDNKFDTVMAEIAKAKADLENKLSEQNQNISNQLNDLKASLEKSIAELDKSTSKEMARLEDTKTNRKALGKMLQNIGEKLMQ